MFNGIITELGRVVDLKKKDGETTVVIHAPQTVADVAIGDSIAVNGTCLSVTAFNGPLWEANVVAETLRCTCLGDLKVNDPVNLERPMRFNGRIDGHFVQGHVDGVGTILSKIPQTDGSTEVTFSVPSSIVRYIVKKGSIALDGVSLTVAEVNTPSSTVTIAIIPLTAKNTTLGLKSTGEKVNVEVDILGKYVEKLVSPKG